ncbi:MAG: cation:proton antiporter [Bacteroidales bacterium]|nr:cation:proton antiporter [Bacteroidales bacterium]
MGENMNLVEDLALILISAGVITIIFKLLKQPLVLGYIVAGFIVGPHFGLFPTVFDTTSIEEWSEIGIIFLMFALGLEFSFKKMLKMGSTAIIAAAIEIVLMMGIGALSGYLMHWSLMECIFLGGMLAMSSTTIIIKAFEDLGLKKEPFADLTMVILIIQDIVAILMMVLLSTAAASQQFHGQEMLKVIAKLLFFLILWFVVGIAIIPTFFRKAKKYINDETLLIISIGLCFGMVVFANYVGFSSALGAFVMGSILCETVEGKHIEHITKGAKDLFAAIFFVSVGMMVDPAILMKYWQPILFLTIITLVVKAFISAGGVLLAGESLSVSVKTGFSLSQIGEFAFIIASLGVSLGVLSNYIYPVIVAVSVITTFTTPYCIRLADPFTRWVSRILPPQTKKALDEYSLVGKTNRAPGAWGIILKKSLLRSVIFGILCFSITFIAFQYFYPFMINLLSDHMPVSLINTINALILLTFISPFLYGLMSNNHSTQSLYAQLWKEGQLNRVGIVAWTVLRIIIAGFFVMVILSKSFRFTKFVIFLLAIAIVMLFLFSRRTLRRFTKIEDNFMTNLNAKEMNEAQE